MQRFIIADGERSSPRHRAAIASRHLRLILPADIRIVSVSCCLHAHARVRTLLIESARRITIPTSFRRPHIYYPICLYHHFFFFFYFRLIASSDFDPRSFLFYFIERDDYYDIYVYTYINYFLLSFSPDRSTLFPFYRSCALPERLREQVGAVVSRARRFSGRTAIEEKRNHGGTGGLSVAT